MKYLTCFVVIAICLFGSTVGSCQEGLTVKLLTHDGKDIEGKVLSSNEDVIQLAADTGTQIINWRDVAVLMPVTQDVPPHPPDAEPASAPQWVISIQPKASLTEGTQSQQTLGGQLALRRSTEVQSLTAGFDANNSLTTQKGTSSIRTHEYDGDIADELFVTDRSYLHGIGDGYHNSSLHLYLEQFYGGGAGRTFISSQKDKLTMTTDLLFATEHFTTTSPSESFPALRLNESYAHSFGKLQGAKLPMTLSETITGLPSLNRADGWQLRGGATLSIPISKLFSMSFGFSDDYMENAPNARKNYSSSSTGLNFSFPASD
ncbi:MAG TPA: DUF481 domain-containing protein [Terriglobales bacterium]|nr:DUF481 domain-containing protein [Terriglobales bacterium]